MVSFPTDSKGPLYKVINESALDIASHKHGCCVLQRCLENAESAQQETLSEIIVEHVETLIRDPFGNYLVQNVFELECPDKIH